MHLLLNYNIIIRSNATYMQAFCIIQILQSYQSTL